ncbi:MAG: hypothetical protein QF371_10350, partial [Flavobacteriales bacterium]|nr:hypothetical protein [Flavobacteriales bacterium]
VVAINSGVCKIAKKSGIVEYVDSSRIVIRNNSKNNKNISQVSIYKLDKYRRSNHNTCFNQKPIVNVGDNVSCGKIIADGP